MNATQLINMILRQVIRTFVNKGVNAGMNTLSKNDGQSKQIRQTAKRARQAARISRRLTK